MAKVATIMVCVVCVIGSVVVFAADSDRVRADEPERSGSDVFGITVSSDGSALPGVLISLSGDGAKQRTVSATDGAFEFSSIPPGDYTVVFQASGKKKVKRKIPVATEDVNMGKVLID